MSNFVKFYVIALAGTIIALAVSILMCVTFEWNAVSIICLGLSIALLAFVNVMLYLELKQSRKEALKPTETIVEEVKESEEK